MITNSSLPHQEEKKGHWMHCRIRVPPQGMEVRGMVSTSTGESKELDAMSCTI